MAKSGTEAVVAKIPECDVHLIRDRGSVPAVYDAKLTFLGGSWAYVCQSCFDTHTSGKLGTGIGQRLILAQ